MLCDQGSVQTCFLNLYVVQVCMNLGQFPCMYCMFAIFWHSADRNFNVFHNITYHWIDHDEYIQIILTMVSSDPWLLSYGDRHGRGS